MTQNNNPFSGGPDYPRYLANTFGDSKKPLFCPAPASGGQQISVRLKPERLALIDVLSAQSGWSRNQIIDAILDTGLRPLFDFLSDPESDEIMNHVIAIVTGKSVFTIEQQVPPSDGRVALGVCVVEFLPAGPPKKRHWVDDDGNLFINEAAANLWISNRQGRGMIKIEPFMIESESVADAYLKDLLTKSEYRSMDEVTIRAQKFIQDENLKNYFINKAKEILGS